MRGIGEFMLEKHLQTPFLFVGSSYMYEDYGAMKEALAKLKNNLQSYGTPKSYSPLVFAVTGTGRVSKGVMEVFE